MQSQETLPEEIRRGSYVFVLSIYETLESLPRQSVLIRDIESHADRFLSFVARHSIASDKGQSIKDIVSELKGMRALLGVMRDTNALEPGSARSLIERCAAVDLAFSELNPVVISRPLEQRPITSRPKVLSPQKIPAANIPMIRQEPPEEDAGGTPEKSDSVKSDVSLRQKAILEVLKRRDKTTVGELGLLFSGKVSKKTLQRDLIDLVSRRMIGREGDRRWTTYYLV